MTFKNTRGTEFQTYLAEAKRATMGLESREKLLESVENLANALTEVQKMGRANLGIMKMDLNTYQRYCEQAVKLLDTAEEKAPMATNIIKKSLPIIDQKIKNSLGGIEEKTKKFCVDSSGTPLDKAGRNVYDHTKGLADAVYPLEVEVRLNRLSPILRSICTILPEESQKVIYSQLGEIEGAALNHKVTIIESALSSIDVQMNSLRKELAERNKWIDYLKDLVLKKLDNINYGVFKLKIRSVEIVPTLREIQAELNKLKKIKADIDNIGLSLAEWGNLQHHDSETINEEITGLAEEIESKVLPMLSETSERQEVIEKLQELKQSKGELWFNRLAALSSITGLLIAVL